MADSVAYFWFPPARLCVVAVQVAAFLRMGERLVAAHHVTPGAPSSPRQGHGSHGAAQAGGGPTPAQRAEVLAYLRELYLVAV
jgi:hypothetical protein